MVPKLQPSAVTLHVINNKESIVLKKEQMWKLLLQVKYCRCTCGKKIYCHGQVSLFDQQVSGAELPFFIFFIFFISSTLLCLCKLLD